MKVHLRNKSGQFCTLAEFCSEQPKAEVYAFSIQNADKNIRKNQDELIKIARLVEIIDAFDLKQSGDGYHTNSTSPSIINVAINKNGSWASCYNSEVGRDYSNCYVPAAQKIIDEQEKLAAKWQSTSYEVA